MSDELDKKLGEILWMEDADKTQERVSAIKKAFKDDGWVRIPGSQNKNVTIFTHDSENERFMTFDEWAEEALAKGWQRGTA